MTLSEAVKAAGIGGRIKRAVWELPGEMGWIEVTDQDAFSFAEMTSDDWTVVQRAPREWTMWIGNGDPHGEQLGCMDGPCRPIRVREVVE
jgi:hypothetical protein